MTEQEAIRRVKKLFKLYVEYEPYSEHYLYADALKMTEEALEKQIPKKPKIVEADMDGMDMETGEEYTYKIDEAHCSRCDSLIGNYRDFGSAVDMKTDNEIIAEYEEKFCNQCEHKDHCHTPCVTITRYIFELESEVEE